MLPAQCFALLLSMDVEEAFKQQMAMMGVSHFSWWSLLAAFVFGIVGVYAFRIGKREGNFGVVFTGIAMMVYPMFTNGPWMDWILGFALCGLAYYLRHKAQQTG